jgi:hypothetical protein
MLFVRGDRNTNMNLGPAAPPSNTVLRAKGTLKTGQLSIPTVDSFNVIGNPFAATIDMRRINRAGGVSEFFYLWDSRLASVGGFQTFGKNLAGDYEAVPGGGSYAAPYGDASMYNFIQSGQAFFVESTGTGSVTIKEEAKDLTSNSMIFSPVTQGQQLRTNLYAVSTSTPLLDATLTQFTNDGNNAVDMKDAKKIPGMSGGTQLGMLREGKNLIIERRKSIAVNDTIFYNLMSASKRNYRFEFIADNLNLTGDVVSGFLEDAYLKTVTPVDLNDTTRIDFTVNADAASSAFDRFRLVFVAKFIVLASPFTFKNVRAVQNDNIAVEWITQNEEDITSYDVETSANGQQFEKVATVMAKGSTTTENYQWLDANTRAGMHYYRIRSINDKGDVVYSKIVSVNVTIGRRDIRVYPNPVTGGSINVWFRNQPEGNYNVRLFNTLGQVILIKQMYHAEGTSIKTIKVSKNMVDGAYKLEITRPDKSTYNINVILQ